MIPAQLIVAGVIAAASFAGAWSIQANRYDKTISDIHAQQALALAAATKEAHGATLRLQRKADDAQKVAATRIAALARDVARTRSVADGLRNDLTTARSALPTATCDSVRVHAATLNTVFGECSTAIEGLAGQAQGHALDTLKLLESWPIIEPLR